MNTIVEQKRFSTREDLTLFVNTENIGMKIEGRDSNETELKLNMNLDKDLTFEDIFKIEFDEDRNSLNIEVQEIEDCGFKNVNLKLYVPKSTIVKVDSKNGGFKISDIEAP